MKGNQTKSRNNGLRQISLPAAMAVVLTVAGCGKSENEQAKLQNPLNEDVPGHDAVVTGVDAPQPMPGSLASLADEAASFQGSSAELVVKLEALQQSLNEALPGLPENVRTGVTQDLKAMQNAVDANDWEGAQEASASIVARLQEIPAKAQ